MLFRCYIVGFCKCSMFCCAWLWVHSSFAIILMGKREPVALLFVFLESRDWCVALPYDAMGLSAGCDCGIFLSYSCKVHPNPHSMCFCHSITLFKCNEGPIPNQITQPFISERSMTKAWLKMSLKKYFAYKKYTPKSLFFCRKYIFLFHDSYNIPHTNVFNISISDVLVFSIFNTIGMI